MLVTRMKSIDPLFNNLYQREHFAGSYPDGLKIGKPSEYDMNLIIKLPVPAKQLQVRAILLTTFKKFKKICLVSSNAKFISV